MPRFSFKKLNLIAGSLSDADPDIRAYAKEYLTRFKAGLAWLGSVLLLTCLVVCAGFAMNKLTRQLEVDRSIAVDKSSGPGTLDG